MSDRVTGPEEFTGSEQNAEQQPQGQDVPEDEGVLQPGAAASAEEAAVHVIDEEVEPESGPEQMQERELDEEQRQEQQR